MKNLQAHAPEAMKAFAAFDRAAVADGAIPGRYKELMAFAVPCSTQCPDCIEIHANDARGLGTSDREIAQALLVAAPSPRGHMR